MFGRYGAAPDPPGSACRPSESSPHSRACRCWRCGWHWGRDECPDGLAPWGTAVQSQSRSARAPWISGTQGLHRPKDVATGGERRAGAGAMAIGVLTVGPTADGIEVLHGLTWGFQTQTPDGIARARERSRGAVQHQDRLVGGGGDGWRRGGEPGGRGQIHLSGRTGHDQQRQQLQRETRPNDHSSQANRPEPYGRFLFAEEIKASALTVPF